MGREDDIVKLWKKALRYGRAKGLGVEADDFASYAVTKWLRGKSQHQLISDTYKDFMRAVDGPARPTQSSDAVSYRHAYFNEIKPDAASASFKEPSCIDWYGLCDTKRDRETLKMLFAGFSQKDIADMYGLSEGAMTHRMNGIIERFRKKLNLERMKDGTYREAKRREDEDS